MATIPVEKKSAAPWWLWLLGALLLALLIWFFFLRSNDDDTAAVDNTEETAPMAAPLNLADVWVTRLAGDTAFFVAPDSAGTDETLVVLDGDAVAALATLVPGQHVSLTGDLMPKGTTDLAAMGVPAADAAMVAPEAQYVRATGLTVLNPGMADGMMADGMMDGGTMPDTTMATVATPAPEPAVPATGPITSAEALYADDLKPLVGRTVEVDNATVLSLAGDSTFYVGAGNRRFLVALSRLGESEAGAGDGSDGRFDINVGDKLNLRGTVTAFDAANTAFHALSAADRAAASTRGAFVNVTRAADITKR